MEKQGPADPLGVPPGGAWGRIGAYRLLARLGAGGMGQVYLARSDRGRTVAVKLVRQELAEQEEFRARFRQEVEAARRVGGYWTAPVLDADTEAAVPWVATGYVAGPSLQQVVGHDHGALPERSVRILAAGLAHALQDIHAAGIVHRDLKPSNVLVTIDGPRVIDFGIARALETVAGDGLTRTGSLIGSPGFMAPEQVRGDRVTSACDVFCLGSVLAYAATGALPFGGMDSGVHAVMFRIAQEEPDLEGVPEGIADLVRECLRKDPAARPSLDRILERTGAEDTVSGGRSRDPWLPSALVAQLGRHAVQLLNAEDPETTPHLPTPTSPSTPAASAPGPIPPHRPTPAADAGSIPPHRSAPAADAGSIPPYPPAPAAANAGSVPPRPTAPAAGNSGSMPPRPPASAASAAGSIPPHPSAPAAHAGPIPPYPPAPAAANAGSVPPRPSAPAADAGSIPPHPTAPAAAHGQSNPPQSPAAASAHGGSASHPPVPAAADGGSAPQGPPAPDDESGTGGAGGNPIPADGRAPEHAPAPAADNAQPPLDHLPTLIAPTPTPTPPPAPPTYVAQNPYGGHPHQHAQPPAAYGYPHHSQPYNPYGGSLGPTPPYGPPPFGTPQEPTRRDGRSTALLVVIALVVALGAGGSVYALMKHGGDDKAGGTVSPAPTDTTTSAPSDTSPPATPTPSTAAPTSSAPTDGVVPAGYLGTWVTTIDNANGTNTRQLTIEQGQVGDPVLTLVADGPSDGGGTYHCVFEATLTEQPGSDGSLEIGPSVVTSGEPASSCTPGEATEVTLLPDGRLKRAKASGGESLTYTRQ